VSKITYRDLELNFSIFVNGKPVAVTIGKSPEVLEFIRLTGAVKETGHG
jgi:hypothetical protein